MAIFLLILGSGILTVIKKNEEAGAAASAFLPKCFGNVSKATIMYILKEIEQNTKAYVKPSIAKKERSFMKNFIKIITIFAMTIFVSPVHSAESEQKKESKQETPYYLSKNMLTMNNPLSDMHKLFISPWRESWNRPCIPSGHSLCIDEGLALKLTVIKFFEEADVTRRNLKIYGKEETTLSVIRDAVNKGALVASKHNIILDDWFIKILASQTPISVYEFIKNWSEQEKPQLVDEDKKNRLIVAISESKRERKKRLDFALDQNAISADIINLIHLFAEYNIGEDEPPLQTLIKRARQALDRKQKKNRDRSRRK